MNRKQLPLLLFLVVSIINGCSEHSTSQKSSPSGGILFTERDRSTGVCGISWIRPDGNNYRNVIRYARLVAAPAEGTMLYASTNGDPHGDGAIFAAATSGANARPIFTYRYNGRDPAWVQLAANGTFAGYSLSSDPDRIFFVDTYGREFQTVHARHRDVAIAPDSRHCSYISKDRANELVILDLERIGLRDTIRFEDISITQALWSSDASVVFVRARDRLGAENVYSVARATGAQQLIIRDTSGGVTDMRWSPGGSSIAIGNRDGLWLTSGDGKGLKKLFSSNIGTVAGIDWAKNGTRILFVAGSATEGSTLMMVNPITHEESYVTGPCIDGYWDQ